MGPISGKIADTRRAVIAKLQRRDDNPTFADVCDRNADELPDRIAVIDRVRRLSWEAVRTNSDRLAQALLDHGIMRPDVALIHLGNSTEHFLIRLACEKAGIRVILTTTAFRETELISIIERAKPSIAFVSARLAGRGHYDPLRRTLEERGVGLEFVVVGSEPVPWGKTYEELLASATTPIVSLLARTRFGWDERFYFVTTSGSTGAPKIADTIFGHRLWLSLKHAAGLRLAVGERLAAMPPMTSGTSDSLVHHAAPYFAATSVLESHFEADSTCMLLATEEVDIATTVPTMLARMLASGAIDRLADAPLRCFPTYASSISYDLAAAIEDRGCCTVVRCYGTMDFGGISMSTMDDDREARIRTVGKPFAENDVRIIDSYGNEVPRGVEGEIVMRPSQLVMGGGYLRDLEKSRVAWASEYYHLGDFGHFDADGNIVLVGRGEELIIRGGQNVVPAEVEELMLSHPDVIDAIVVGLPDDELGERVCACVILEVGAMLDLDGVKQHFDGLGVASFKCPERIAFFDEFPIAMSGVKVDRRRMIALVGPG